MFVCLLYYLHIFISVSSSFSTQLEIKVFLWTYLYYHGQNIYEITSRGLLIPKVSITVRSRLIRRQITVNILFWLLCGQIFLSFQHGQNFVCFVTVIQGGPPIHPYKREWRKKLFLCQSSVMEQGYTHTLDLTCKVEKQAKCKNLLAKHSRLVVYPKINTELKHEYTKKLTRRTSYQSQQISALLLGTMKVWSSFNWWLYAIFFSYHK